MLLTLCIGIFFLLMGLFKLNKLLATRRQSERTTGVILRYNELLRPTITNDEDDPYPVVQYATSQGESITETYHISSQLYTIGSKVQVYYNPSNPREFIIGDMISTIKPGIMIFFGLLNIVLSFNLPG